MKFSKEIKTGIIAISAIVFLVLGVNFLKGNSFFGGDETYYAYFTNSGGVTPAANVMVNGVAVGKVLKVELTSSPDSTKRVLVSFNIQIEDFKIPKGSVIQAGSLDLFSSGITIIPGKDLTKGYYRPGDYLLGESSSDMIAQVKTYIGPITNKLETLTENVDKLVVSVSAFWDSTASSSLKESLTEVRLTISKLNNIAGDVDNLVETERVQLHRILKNVDDITANLKSSNEKISSIIGNAQKITDDLVTADFKSVIGDARSTIQNLNNLLKNATEGDGTLGALINDKKLYNELVITNKSLQDLLSDLQLHPERYIHFSVLGSKSKGVQLKPSQEKKLKNLLDSIPE